METQNQKNEVGAAVGIIIVVIVIVIGGIYFFNQRVEKQKQMAASSDDVSSLQADSSSMNFDNLDSGVDQLQ